jgi:molybdate transport system substrate-binding protein
VDYIGPLPLGAQQVTVFSAGVTASSKNPDAAKALIKFLASPSALPAIVKSGLEPAASR